MYTEGFQKGNWSMVYAMGTLLSICAIGVLLAYYAIIGSIGRSPGPPRRTRGGAR
jgi:putative spermidine/putrescine transport system permease protein